MAGIAAVALAGCGGVSSSKDYSSTIAQSVMTNGAQQVQATASSLGGGGATMKDANCVQTADTETYTCIAHYADTDASGNTYQYELNISASCDSGGDCQWHSDGNGSLTGEQPAQPAQGSACTPTGGGTGVIVIEGPTAANPGQADCVPQ